MKTKSKPRKPRADFPLFPHASGQWAKKIKGQLRYFGVWADPDTALNKYLDEVNHWQAGRTPPNKETTVADILDGFLGDKFRLLESGEIGQRTYYEYEAVCDTIADALGKAIPVELLTFDDLADLRSVLGKGKHKTAVSPVTHKRLLTFARMVFNHANEEMGQSNKYKKALRSPNAKTIRKARNKNGERLFTAAEIRKLVRLARPQLCTMILLGINCGFGNADCGTLPIEQLDLKGGWHHYWRPKTQVRGGVHCGPKPSKRSRPLWASEQAGWFSSRSMATPGRFRTDHAIQLRMSFAS